MIGSQANEKTTAVENPIAVINALQKQIEHLEAALRNQEAYSLHHLRDTVRWVLMGLRAQAIIPLYLGKENRNEALDQFGINLDYPFDAIVGEVLRDHLWRLDDAPIPDEMKEALREACQYGCNRWELQTSSPLQQS